MRVCEKEDDGGDEKDESVLVALLKSVILGTFKVHWV